MFGLIFSVTFGSAAIVNAILMLRTDRESWKSNKLARFALGCSNMGLVICCLCSSFLNLDNLNDNIWRTASLQPLLFIFSAAILYLGYLARQALREKSADFAGSSVPN